MENKPRKIIFHHSADGFASPQFDKINLYHKSRGFPVSSLGLFGGYHWLIERDGTPRQYRKEQEEGAHTKGQNFASIGVCLAGNFDYQMPSAKQEKTAAALTKEIMARWQIPITEIYPHRRFGPTSCPGQLLGDEWLARNHLKHELNWLARLLYALKIRGV